MQIVIDIPDGLKQKIDEGFINQVIIDKLFKAARNAKPLPKYYGRLIDADALKKTEHDIYIESIDYRHRCISIENIDEAPTIIEAESEDKE